MNNIIISNTCVGQFIMKPKNILPYNNPFIGSLIPNDKDYINLINNFDYYIKLEPKIGLPREDSMFYNQTKNSYYQHTQIKVPYPIVYLGDLEIHFIHENNSDICLEKFKRRLLRLNTLIKDKHNIIFTLSFSELINEHVDKEQIINQFFTKYIGNLNIKKYFIGPPEYFNNDENYIIIDEWKNINLDRNSSHIYKFNNQNNLIKIFLNKITFI